MVRERDGKTGMPVVYADKVGGQDELVFDSASFAVDGHGELTHQLPALEETLVLVELVGGMPVKGAVVPMVSLEQDVCNA